MRWEVGKEEMRQIKQDLPHPNSWSGVGYSPTGAGVRGWQVGGEVVGALVISAAALGSDHLLSNPAALPNPHPKGKR